MQALILKARKQYHHDLLSKGILTVDKNGVPSNADKSSKLSISIARGITDQLVAEIKDKAVGQTSGAAFEQINMEFLQNTSSCTVGFYSSCMVKNDSMVG